MGADHEDSEITASQWLKDRVKERFDAREKDRIRRLNRIGWENFEEISNAAGIWKGKSGQEARNLRLRFSTQVLTALGALCHGYGKDNRGRDGRARLSSYRDAVKTLQLIYPPYPSDDQPSSMAAADILPAEKALDVEEANTWLMAAMPADEGWEYSEFRTLLPLLLGAIEKAEQLADRRRVKNKGGRPKGHNAGIAVDTFVYGFCIAVLDCGGKYKHSNKGVLSPQYVGTLIEFLRRGLPSGFPSSDELRSVINSQGKKAKDDWRSWKHQ